MQPPGGLCRGSCIQATSEPLETNLGTSTCEVRLRRSNFGNPTMSFDAEATLRSRCPTSHRNPWLRTCPTIVSSLPSLTHSRILLCFQSCILADLESYSEILTETPWTGFKSFSETISGICVSEHHLSSGLREESLRASRGTVTIGFRIC